MSERWNITWCPSQDDPSTLIVTAARSGEELYASARRGKRGAIQLSVWQTEDGIPVDNRFLTTKARRVIGGAGRDAR